MAEHIPFITGEDGANLVRQVYHDSDIVRVPLDRATRFLPLLPKSSKVWLDPCVEGMDDLKTRRSQPGRRNTWFDFMGQFPNFQKIGAPSYHAGPVSSEVQAFVKAVMDKCAATNKPAWITVPQIPLVNDSSRNKINRALAVATGKWKSTSGFAGRLILPLVFTHQEQLNGKMARNPKVQQAERYYHEAQADGFWIVDKSLMDESGSSMLRNKRFPGIIDLHKELNERISSKIRVAGPYWALNLVLWASGLVDHPAIGIGSGYQFFMAGGHSKQASAKLALPSLRRRVGVGLQLKTWLNEAIAELSPSHPAHAEFSKIKSQYTVLSESSRARKQVAVFYKQWFDTIASTPKAGRSMALFQDLSAAYALGKSLPNLKEQGTSRKPEAVAEPLMLSCL